MEERGIPWREQGTTGRYATVPRTLTFLFHGEDVLLMRRAPGKGPWAGRLNGIGGHIEPGEGVLAGALREVREETGLQPVDLTLRGVVHVAAPSPTEAGVMLFVFLGSAPTRVLAPSAEGEPGWYPAAALREPDVLEDVPLLVSRLRSARRRGAMVWGHYGVSVDGALRYAFVESSCG